MIKIVTDSTCYLPPVLLAEHDIRVVPIVLVPHTLEYLHRGGRINTVQAWVGTLLRVKPMLALQAGVIEPLEKVRTANWGIQ